MKKDALDDRIHALLDGELPAHEAKALEKELSPEDAALLAQLSAAAEAKRAVPALPDDFERRVMARVATRPAPRPSLLARLSQPFVLFEWSPLAMASAAAMALFAVGGAGVIGYRAGQVRQPAQPEPVAQAAAPVEAPKPEEGVVVRFALKAPDARKVEVVGSFTGWGAKGVELEKGENGTWVASLKVPKGHHEYTFVVDGAKWVPDPAAAQLIDDGFGGTNAVLEL